MIYVFRHPERDEVIEVCQKMEEDHIYIDEEGVQWQRVFSAPNMSMDTKIDPFSSKQFVEKTKGAGTMGELWDRAQEMSDKRAEKIGAADPIRKKKVESLTPKKRKISKK